MQRQDYDMAFLLRYENIAWYEEGKVRILDRRIYPVKTEFVVCEDHKSVAQAIADMVTQSYGPYKAAAMGMALAAHQAKDFSESKFLEYMEKAAYTLSHARPTTVKRMIDITKRALEVAKKALADGKSGEQIAEAIFNDNIDSLNDKYIQYQKVGDNLAELIPDGGTTMTQCYGETVIGTVLRALRKRSADGKSSGGFKFICPETRPYYQGARLTASVIQDMGFEVSVITDNMPAFIMHQGKVDVFTSAADVICMDGHIVNKVGTLQIALAAKHYGIPYYVTGTPNIHHPTVDSVVIEQRDPSLVLESMGQKHTMDGVKGMYPSFDITPPELCNGVVTDKGVYACNDLKKYFE